MSERDIGVIIDENDSGFVVKVYRGDACKIKLPISPNATPKAVSEMLLTEGAHLKCDRSLIRLGDMLMTAADKVPGLVVDDDYWQVLDSKVNIPPSFGGRGRNISSVGIINANPDNNSESDWDDGALPEVVM